MNDKKSTSNDPFCSFCGKTSEEVDKLIAGPGVYICDECIMLCAELVDDQNVIENLRTIQVLDENAFNNTCAYIEGVADTLQSNNLKVKD